MKEEGLWVGLLDGNTAAREGKNTASDTPVTAAANFSVLVMITSINTTHICFTTHALKCVFTAQPLSQQHVPLSVIKMTQTTWTEITNDSQFMVKVTQSQCSSRIRNK